MMQNSVYRCTYSPEFGPGNDVRFNQPVYILPLRQESEIDSIFKDSIVFV